MNSTIKTDDEPPEVEIDSDIMSDGSIVIEIPTEDNESFIVFDEEE